MDPGSLNALGILAVAMITAVCITWKPGRPRRRWRWALAVCAGGAILLVGGVAGMHKCDAGAPFFQWLIPAACATCAALFMRPWQGAVSLAVISMVSGGWLSFHMVHLIHGCGYIGNPRSKSLSEVWVLRASATELQSRLSKRKADERELQAGWLHEPDLPRGVLGRPPLQVVGARMDTWPLWHTWLTGMRGARVVHDGAGIWFPGGTLAEGAQGLEVRHIPDPTTGPAAPDREVP